MPKPTDEEKQKKEIEKKEKQLAKLRKTFEKVPFSYTSTFDEGVFTSLGKINILDGKFDLKGFAQYDVSDDAQLDNEEVAIYLPDGTIDTFNLTELGIAFNDLEEDFSLLKSDALDKNIAHYRMLEINLNMSKKSAEKQMNDTMDDTMDDTPENTKAFRI